MDARTEKIIRTITYQVAEECGMKTAIESVPDRLQEESKEWAEYLLKKTALSTGNSWTNAENERLQKQMRQVINEKTRTHTVINENKQREYELRLDAKIKRAIRDGKIPDPKDDPEYRRMMAR
jgi:hypothetical protein